MFRPLAIRAGDLGQAIRFLQAFSETSGRELFTRPMLVELGRLIAADTVEYFELRERDRAGLTYVTSRDLEDAHLVEGWMAFRHQNPVGAFRWTPADGAIRLSSVVSWRQMRALDLYDAYWRPAGVRDQLKIWLWRSNDTAVCISMDRSDGVFSDGEVAMLEVLQPQLAEMRAAANQLAAVDPNVSLTRREAQVLSCLAAGHQNARIADILCMSPATVRKHLEHTYAKLGVRGRGEAVAALMRAQRDGEAGTDEAR